jgi:hypothetical protein
MNLNALYTNTLLATDLAEFISHPPSGSHQISARTCPCIAQSVPYRAQTLPVVNMPACQVHELLSDKAYIDNLRSCTC